MHLTFRYAILLFSFPIPIEPQTYFLYGKPSNVFVNKEIDEIFNLTKTYTNFYSSVVQFSFNTIFEK